MHIRYNGASKVIRRICEFLDGVVTGVKGDSEAAYRTGDVNITKGNIGLGNVTNYDQSKAVKSISRSGTTFTATCLDNSTFTFDQQDNNTWTAMVGATSSTNGSVGYVNAVPPKNGYNTKYLRADGSWQVPPNDNTWTALSGATSSADGVAGYAPKPTKGQQNNILTGNAAWSTPQAVRNNMGLGNTTGALPIANGGTGSDTKNFVDLTTNQTVAGSKTFSGNTILSGTIFLNNTGHYNQRSPYTQKGTADSSNREYGFQVFEKGSGTAAANLLGKFYTSIRKNNTYAISGIHAYYNGSDAAGSDEHGYLNLWVCSDTNHTRYVETDGYLYVKRNYFTMTADSVYDVLHCKYINAGGKEKDTVAIGVYADSDTTSNDSTVVVGSSTGATILRSGDGAATVIANEDIRRGEFISIMADTYIRFYTNCNTPANANKAIQIDQGTGNTNIYKALNVTGATTLSSTLAVTGKATFREVSLTSLTTPNGCVLDPYGYVMRQRSSTKGVSDSSNRNWNFRILDATGANDDAHAFGALRSVVSKDLGIVYTAIRAFANVDPNTDAEAASKYAAIAVGMKSDGTAVTQAPTPPAADNSTQIATTEWVTAKGYKTTDHTYTAGKGLTLSSSAFSLSTFQIVSSSGTNVSHAASSSWYTLGSVNGLTSGSTVLIFAKISTKFTTANQYASYRVILGTSGSAITAEEDACNPTANATVLRTLTYVGTISNATLTLQIKNTNSTATISVWTIKVLVLNKG